MFDFRGKSPKDTGPALCTMHSKCVKKKTSETRTAVKLDALRGNVARFDGGKGPFSLNPCLVPPSFPSPSPSLSPKGHTRSGMAQGGPGRAQIPSPPSQIAAPHRRRVVTFGLAVGVRGSPFS